MIDVLFTEDLVTEITASVWRAFLPDAEEILPYQVTSADDSLTGIVHISGEWNGLVSMTCSSTAATRAAAFMFGTGFDEVETSDVLDAVGELVNIVGGNIKGMLPPPTGLSLPSVTDGSLHVDTRSGADLMVDVNLSWMGEPVHIAVWGRGASGS
jgi:chemotaxis protein CheX